MANAAPYTDLQIADILHEKCSIKVARRTVAKYREKLGIQTAKLRREL